MKKTLLPWQLLTLLAIAGPSLYLLAVWPALPSQVATHFDAAGHANGYTSRGHLWLLTLALPLGVALLFSVLPRLDPKRRLDGGSANFQKLRLAVVALLGGLAAYCIYLELHPGVSPSRGIAVLVGLFLFFIGNYLTTVQPNYFVGIRTPWTLESPTVWARTHRVGGMVFCGAGLLLAVLGWVLPAAWLQPALLVLVLGTAGFAYAYSYLLFREEQLHKTT